MGAKMLPLLAAVDGVVHRVKFNNADRQLGHDQGRRRLDVPLHPRQQRPPRHRRRPGHPGPGLPRRTSSSGPTVTKGQVVAFLGDSGNAESTGSHLHFEIRQPAPAGSYHGRADQPLRVAPAGHPLEQHARAGTCGRPPTAGPAGRRSSPTACRPATVALLCDWDADGVDEAVVVRAGTWHLRNGIAIGHDRAPDLLRHRRRHPAVRRPRRRPRRRARAVPRRHLDGAGRLRRHRRRWPWTVRYGLKAGDQPVARRLGRQRRRRSRHPPRRRRGTSAPPARWPASTATTFRYGLQAGDRPGRRRLGRRRRRRRRHLPRRPVAPPLDRRADAAARCDLHLRHRRRPARGRRLAPTPASRASAPSGRRPADAAALSGGAGPWRCG